MKKRITITIDEELLQSIDEKRNLIPRSAYIEEALRRQLTPVA